jgi:cytochrome oxidase Cu insertion factor (SCO1/SenC/PrrC family)
MSSGIRLTAIAGLLGFAMTLAHGQSPGKPAPEELTGLKVGSTAPKFTLEDQSGTARSLDALLEKGPVALVFYRSASW